MADYPSVRKRKHRYYSVNNVVYDRDWFAPINGKEPPPFTLAHCRNAKIARILVQKLRGETVLEVDKQYATET